MVRARDARTSIWIVALTALAVAASAFFVFSLVPSVIEHAYRGESIGPLNRMIAGQSEHPVEFYLSAWSAVAKGVLAAEVVLGFLLAVATFPPLQRFADARVGPLPTGSDTRERWRMSRARVALASSVVLVLAGAQLFDIAVQAEHWPFSHYNMYVTPATEALSLIEIDGVTRDGEVSLDPREFHPFDEVRLPYALSTILEGDDWRSRAQLALRNLHELYEQGRSSGSHDGPHLESLRLYRLQWRVEPTLANRDRPDQKTLLYEMPIP